MGIRHGTGYHDQKILRVWFALRLTDTNDRRMGSGIPPSIADSATGPRPLSATQDGAHHKAPIELEVDAGYASIPGPAGVHVGEFV